MKHRHKHRHQTYTHTDFNSIMEVIEVLVLVPDTTRVGYVFSLRCRCYRALKRYRMNCDMLHRISYFLASSMHDELCWSKEATMADTYNTDLTRPILVQKTFNSPPIKAVSGSSHGWHLSQDLHHIAFETTVVWEIKLFCWFLQFNISRIRWNWNFHGIIFLVG